MHKKKLKDVAIMQSEYKNKKKSILLLNFSFSSHIMTWTTNIIHCFYTQSIVMRRDLTNMDTKRLHVFSFC